jgi:hypothetical protein
MRLVWSVVAVGSLGIFFLVLFPFVISAHEVYVLSPETIARDLSTDSPNPFEAFSTNRFQFFLWGFIAFVVVSTIFFASITHRFEIFFEPWLSRLRPWASPVARATLGVCLIASAYNGALFGPELPLSEFGSWEICVQLGLYFAGALMLWKRLAPVGGVIALCIFALAMIWHGFYMLTYANYMGEILLTVFLIRPGFEALAFLALRIGFGVSVAFAALYAKFLHSNLALSVVHEYNLTQFFHFDPLFVVLGACIIEVLIGIFFIVGFEIRHTALFFLFWIFLSLLYFGEAVWPHLILVSVNAALFMYGYDKWTIEGRLFNRGKLQPFL